jgi:hypothetical protein
VHKVGNKIESRYNIFICQTYDMLQPDNTYKRLKTIKSIRRKFISNNTIISEEDEGNSVVIIIRSTCNDCGFSTLTEVFPCFFLSCKVNARVYLTKTGHGPHSSQLGDKFYAVSSLLILF